jgi:hypothetical protein
MAEGRAFNREEITKGSRVCIISAQLAEINGLRVGDNITLRKYPASITRVFVRDKFAWVPTPYHPGLHLTQPAEYTIVGIYQGPAQEMNDHAISPNTVFIPAASLTCIGGLPANEPTNNPDARTNNSPAESDSERPSPPLLDTIIVPNGRISEVLSLIEETMEGYGMFFRFYDQGYSAMKPVLSNLRTGMMWIMVMAFAGWGIAVIMFSLFYIGRKRNETGLLFAVGVNRMRRIRWVFVQAAVVIVLAQCIILGATLPVYENILDTAVNAAESFTDSYRDYRLSEMQEAGGMQLRLPLDKTTLGLVVASASQTVLLFGVAIVLSIQVSKKKTLSMQKNEVN